jgi:hypothetical protein
MTQQLMLSGPGVAYTDIPNAGTAKKITLRDGNWEREFFVGVRMSPTDVCTAIVEKVREHRNHITFTDSDIIDFAFEFMHCRAGHGFFALGIYIEWEFFASEGAE